MKNPWTGRPAALVVGVTLVGAGQIIKEIAQSLISSKKIAIKTGTRKLATAYYNCLTKGIAYVEQGGQIPSAKKL